ncbi:MAG: FAH family protein [Pseudogulbenkiania sp.]|nr:FAH family protein [Pseudogulbenkiania sp.]
MRLIQFQQADGTTGVGLVLEDSHAVEVIDAPPSGVIGLAQLAITRGLPLRDLVAGRRTGQILSYQQLIDDGRLLLPVSHPQPERCFVAGTGLTHLGSADTRSAMHAKLEGKDAELTDSMKMFKLGVEGGKPLRGQIGSQPEWFYKGDGSSLVPPGADLAAPGFALDAGEEPELVGLYLIGLDGQPYRIGFAVGNEFSDHVTERHNYLWLAHSKLRPSSFGPELFIGELPAHLEGESRILRNGETLWKKPFVTGEANMSHTLANLEHHHFKYAQFRHPGDLHVHFFGTATLSFADSVSAQDGDVFEIHLPHFGRPLRNRLAFAKGETLVEVKEL